MRKYRMYEVGEIRMISISFGRWTHAAGKYFIAERFYFRGHHWTPFVLLLKRYGRKPPPSTLTWKDCSGPDVKNRR